MCYKYRGDTGNFFSLLHLLSYTQMSYEIVEYSDGEAMERKEMELDKETSSDDDPIIAPPRSRKAITGKSNAVTHLEWSDDEYSDGGRTPCPPDTKNYGREEN